MPGTGRLCKANGTIWNVVDELARRARTALGSSDHEKPSHDPVHCKAGLLEVLLYTASFWRGCDCLPWLETCFYNSVLRNSLLLRCGRESVFICKSGGVSEISVWGALSAFVFLNARPEYRTVTPKCKEIPGGCEEKPLSSLFLLQEFLWLEVPSSILDSLYMFSPCVKGVVYNLESYWEVAEPVRGSAWFGIMWLYEQGQAHDQRVGFLSAGLFLFIFYFFVFPLPPSYLFSPPLFCQLLFFPTPCIASHPKQWIQPTMVYTFRYHKPK